MEGKAGFLILPLKQLHQQGEENELLPLKGQQEQPKVTCHKLKCPIWSLKFVFVFAWFFFCLFVVLFCFLMAAPAACRSSRAKGL